MFFGLGKKAHQNQAPKTCPLGVFLPFHQSCDPHLATKMDDSDVLERHGIFPDLEDSESAIFQPNVR